ncbi:unnamed protein product [Amoebophrya sp. A25]|nr:unnamed protein product [Amoebophrya sp. A25]|eukprot:GSA25T00012169001.1
MGKHSKKTKLTKSEKREKIQAETEQKVVELAELEQRLAGLHMQHQKVQARIQRYERNKRGAILAAANLRTLEEEQPPLYMHLGRAFVLSDFHQIEKDLEQKIKEANENLPQLENIKTQFETRLQAESQNMLQLRKDFMRLGIRA